MKLTAVLLATLAATTALAVDTTDTLLVNDPAISANRIAFAYANDLWTANHDGSGVQRLTSHPGIEASPRFSPDGALIAFTGNYEGNTDVYVVAAGGGVPRRLTWHPGADVVTGFTPDGSAIVFSSPREVHTRRYLQLFTVPLSGGAVAKLPIPNVVRAAYSPDGKKLVYLPIAEPFRQWKNYRGGTASRLLLYDLSTYSVEQIPQPAGRSNDTDPMWIGDTIWFRSDRDGEFNLYSFNPSTKKIEQRTRFADFPVMSANAGAGRIIFEQAGRIHLFDPRSGATTSLKIGIAADLAEMRPRFVKGAKYVRNASISPSGQRAALEFRGEILTLPAEKGDDRNLSQSTGANDRSPVWSADGKSVAWFTDESGEYELRIGSQDGKGTPRRIRVEGAGFYENPKWSPDGKFISYSDNSHSIYLLDITSGASSKLSSHALYRPGPVLDHAWSPDSKWLAYTRMSSTNLNSINLYSIDQKKSFPLGDGLSDAREPLFDPNGKYLYFVASTDAGPVADWFSQSSADISTTNQIYLAVLPKGVESPLAKETDEEGVPIPKPDDKPEADKDKPEGDKKDDAVAKKPAVVKIDFDRLGQRIQALPLSASVYTNLGIAKTGALFYLKSAGGASRFETDDEANLYRFDLTKRKEDMLAEKIEAFELSRDGKRILLRLPKSKWSIADVGDKIDPSKRPLGVDAVEVKIDPVAEWRQIFDEAWRINRDYFYDPNMHGADWKAMKSKYAAFLPHVAARSDLNRVLQWMSSELAVGHHRVTGGDMMETPVVPGGLLGADYKVENGRYRFARVYGGMNWNPLLRAPLTEPGVDVVAGEYLLAVDGKELRYPENLYSRFERTAGRFTEITVGPNPDGSGSRTVKVVPIEDELQLRNRDWVENNLRYVTAKTNGRVAYVYVPNTAGAGHEYFKRYFFPQADREAIIVDERYNGGGQVADYYIDILRRPLISYWATRYGGDLKTPLASIQGPKVMLIDENAGSGGDLLPWMFRKLEMGTLIGRRTWGGLVGILGFPTLMDGGSITAPNLGIWTEEGFIVENEGVAPDIEVEQTPADVLAGRDPQLDKAIEVVMKQLEANPVVRPKRPAFPVRVRR
ncbi:MAG: PD40 domain-containing protein [Thermoanaerobaculia bacterium]|nr:PD40 domain-containing protein [Thermoanaerobaculia bacterium]